MPDDLKDRYHNRCVRLAKQLEQLLKAKRRIFLQMIGEHGAIEATKRLIHADQASDTFTELWQIRRLDLTVEALLVTEPEWDPLFDDRDRDSAEKRLEETPLGLRHSAAARHPARRHSHESP